MCIKRLSTGFNLEIHIYKCICIYVYVYLYMCVHILRILAYIATDMSLLDKNFLL